MAGAQRKRSRGRVCRQNSSGGGFGIEYRSGEEYFIYQTMNRAHILERLGGPGMLRLFLATTVVVQHFTHFHLGLWAVYTFFILSGYWISVMYRRKYRLAKAPVLTFWCSRYMRLAPVYLACMAVALLILRFCSTHWGDRDLVHDPQWLARALLIVSSSGQPLLIPPAWTLDIEMQFYLLAPLLLLAMGRARISQGVAATAAVALFGLFAWRMGGLPRYLAFFLAGALIDRSRWRPSARIALLSLTAFAAILCAVLLTPAWRPMVVFPSIPPPETAHRLSLLLAFATLPLAAYTLGSRSDALDRHAGDLAYSVYLFHPCVLMIANYLAGFHNPMRVLISHWLWLMVLPGSLAMYLLVDRPAEVLRKRFVEARIRKGAPARPYPVGEPAGM